jgi:predicted enzyme related to lactoylglutathione lyase
MPPISMWGSYITVDDVDATADRAKELGGNIIVPITNVPTVGRFCMIQDPQGAVFSVITYE